MSLPNPEDQGTVALLVQILLIGQEGGERLGAASAVLHAAEHLGFWQSDLFAGPERTADRLRKLSHAETVRLRSLFQHVLDAIDDLPPSAFKSQDGLAVLQGEKS